MLDCWFGDGGHCVVARAMHRQRQVGIGEHTASRVSHTTHATMMGYGEPDKTTCSSGRHRFWSKSACAHVKKMRYGIQGDLGAKIPGIILDLRGNPIFSSVTYNQSPP